jgi:hypothetical protein
MTSSAQNLAQRSRPIPATVLVPLREHIDFLVRASDAHDAGYTSEITRCAVALRALFHSPAPYLSWLAQADGLHGNFLSTALPRAIEGAGKFGSLVMIANHDGRPVHFCALDSSWYVRWLKFSDWWNEPVFINDEKKELSRRDLVLAVAAKDGGTNLDPNLGIAYERLLAYEAASGVRSVLPNATSSEPVTNPERAAFRQVVHETLKTLFPTYRKFLSPVSDPRLNSALARGIERPTSMPWPPQIRRNDACPCGSGKKFKGCHGSI